MDIELLNVELCCDTAMNIAANTLGLPSNASEHGPFTTLFLAAHGFGNGKLAASEAHARDLAAHDAK